MYLKFNENHSMHFQKQLRNNIKSILFFRESNDLTSNIGPSLTRCQAKTYCNYVSYSWCFLALTLLRHESC